MSIALEIRDLHMVWYDIERYGMVWDREGGQTNIHKIHTQTYAYKYSNILNTLFAAHDNVP